MPGTVQYLIQHDAKLVYDKQHVAFLISFGGPAVALTVTWTNILIAEVDSIMTVKSGDEISLDPGLLSPRPMAMALSAAPHRAWGTKLPPDDTTQVPPAVVDGISWGDPVRTGTAFDFRSE